MPRKSAAIRLAESQDLVSLYEAAGLPNDYRVRFAKDMIQRLSAGRNMSSKQKKWLDSLIDEGVPEPTGDPELISKIKDAIETPGMEHRSSTLRDFLSKVYASSHLSEKQKYFLEGMLEECKRVKLLGPYRPDDETIEKLKMCVKLSRGYNSVFWTTHAGTKRAMDKVIEWLDDNQQACRIDEWSVNKILNTMSAKLREIYETPYANGGDILWTRKRCQESGEMIYKSCLVVSGPSVDGNGNIIYTTLCEGSVLELNRSMITKRRMS